jgi:hypothetical protein
VKLQLGQSFASTVDKTAVIVMRAPAGEVTLTCGGAEMVHKEAAPAQPGEPDRAQCGGSLMGKRYVDGSDTIEVLCTAAGVGTLALNGEALSVRAAKPLPASD